MTQCMNTRPCVQRTVKCTSVPQICEGEMASSTHWGELSGQSGAGVRRDPGSWGSPSPARPGPSAVTSAGRRLTPARPLPPPDPAPVPSSIRHPAPWLTGV